MSTNEENTGSVRVINEEYERVLSNPDNLIMSEDLQELMDLPIGSQTPEPQLSVDTMSVTIMDQDGLPLTVRGRFSRLACVGECSYELEVESENVRPEFVSALEAYTHSAPTPAPLILSGVYESELDSVRVETWSVEHSGPHASKLKLKFRSDNVIL